MEILESSFKVLIIGNIHSGKSSVGNRLANDVVFEESDMQSPCTKKVEKHTCYLNQLQAEEKLEIVDCPGFHHNLDDSEQQA